MKKLAIFMAPGCEEIEGLTVVDILRRAGMQIDMISITGEKAVTSSHKVTFMADLTLAEALEQGGLGDYDGVILPGGIPGTPNLAANDVVTGACKTFAAEGKLVAAICAAPSVLGACGLLEGKNATSYPGFGEQMPGCNYLTDDVVVDGNIITSRGMGTAIDFALAILAYFTDEPTAKEMADKVMYRHA